MLSKKNISIPGLVLKIIIAWAMIAFVVYPVVSLLIQTFWQDGSLTTDVVGKVFSSARAVKSLKNQIRLPELIYQTRFKTWPEELMPFNRQKNHLMKI